MLRPAPAALRSLVRTLWSHQAIAAAGSHGHTREHVLPSGCLHLVIRLDGPPLRLIDADSGRASESGLARISHTPPAAAADPRAVARSAPVGRLDVVCATPSPSTAPLPAPQHGIDALATEPRGNCGLAVVAGIRDRYYAKQAGDAASSVGVQLLPGAARALFGVSACELAGRHLPLGALLGHDSDRLRERLQSITQAARRLALMADWLTARLASARAPHPVVLEAIVGLRAGDSVVEVVRRSGFSHRHLGARFVDAVGLTPKRFQRVLRFQHVLAAAHRQPARSWLDIALAAGYTDQAHFNREFREFAGVSPGAWRRAAPRHRHHLPIA